MYLQVAFGKNFEEFYTVGYQTILIDDYEFVNSTVPSAEDVLPRDVNLSVCIGLSNVDFRATHS